MAKAKLLIVDEIGAARKLERRLTALGYEVAAIATSADEAIAMTAQAVPDLVLMDMTLCGDMTSRRTADEILRNRPVVFMVGATEEPGAPLPEATDASDRVVKPFTDRELRLTVELALCRHAATRPGDGLDDGFFTASIDMLCHLDFNGHFKRLNPAWERTLGFTRQELMSRPFIEFVHPDDRERTLKQNAQVRGGAQALAFENRYLCKDGSFRWFRWNAVPGAGKQIIYSVARDITANRQADDEREQLVRELQAALAEVKTLRAILPICSYCRKIRDDENSWHTVESYIARHTTSRFSHGICPSCMATEVEPQLQEMERE